MYVRIYALVFSASDVRVIKGGRATLSICGVRLRSEMFLSGLYRARKEGVHGRVRFKAQYNLRVWRHRTADGELLCRIQWAIGVMGVAFGGVSSGMAMGGDGRRWAR